MPLAAPSSSTSATGGGRSRRRWPNRPGELAYAHGSAFTSEPLERYAAAVGTHLPMDGAAIYPVSGGSEAIETALKLARAFHIARGEPDRWIVFSRWGSYHGNTLGALDLSGRKPLRRPYEGWLGRFRHVSAAYPYRAGDPGADALATGDDLADELEAAIVAAGPGTVAAFVAEPIVGATLAAAVPPDDYWPKVAEVCRRHGVLLIADEVMTGFGRTGRWFGLDHWAVKPDMLVAAKGATSGYWPFGFVAASDAVHEAVVDGPGFVHGFTYSHGPVAAAVANEVLRIIEDEDLVAASATKGDRLKAALTEALGRPSGRRGDPRPWPAGGPGARGRSGDPRALSAGRPPDRGHRSRRHGIAACWSTRGPAMPTARTATRSCSARRSSSPTTNWPGSWTSSPRSIPAAVSSLAANAAVSDAG